MQALIDVILPVFIVIGFGYLAAWRGLFSESAVDGLMRFAQNFAIPCLLFRAISQLDLGQNFEFRLLFSFYAGAVTGFIAGFIGARLIFRRPWPDCVAIGFCGLFSNSLLLGLPITERAFGPEALEPNFAIVALHAPFCYALGLTVMELVKAEGAGIGAKVKSILSAIFQNALVIGISLGLVVNLTGLPLPGVFTDALDLVIRAALPAALFGLGGVLMRYKPEGDMATIAMICAISLVLHPAVTFGLGTMLGLSTGQLRSAVVTASMAPGVNSYLFANMYGVAKRVAASSVLIATALSIGTIWVWLHLLP
ncbi:AEC family transporter [Pseudoruegeria sp. HB172150]|uniref:AEC family transporter n=1 Tax=Pseudoruegeria sp. HB172150 TaxID=2721164 RepID=UPI001554542E|nr:AEC family transporter [Pseudoruegeria sp. HB172150]